MQTANVNVKVNAKFEKVDEKRFINVFGERKLDEIKKETTDSTIIRHCNTLFKIVKKNNFMYFQLKLNKFDERLKEYENLASVKRTTGKRMGRGAAIKRGLFEQLYPGEDKKQYTIDRLEKCKKPVDIDSL